MNAAARPLVTVVIPTYNRLEYLKECLASVLAQSYDHLEVIVCDNASTDGTAAYLGALGDDRVRHIRHETPIPPLENWNSWTDVAKGEFATFLPDDDKLQPAFVEKCLSEFLDEEGTVLVKTGCFIIDKDSRVVSSYLPFKEATSGVQYLLDRINPRYSELSLGSGYFFRRMDFIAAGGFVHTGFPHLHTVDDYLWFKIALQSGGLVRYVNEELWAYRSHPSNMARVRALREFEKAYAVYVPMLRALLAGHDAGSGRIDAYLADGYTRDQMRSRILFELNRVRSDTLARALAFIRLNRAIIKEYFGNSRIVYEIAMNVFARAVR